MCAVFDERRFFYRF